MRTRRTVLAWLGAACAVPASAHTPYGQWVVYRQKHMLVGSHRGDPQTYALAQAVVAGLDEALPEARARVARGPRPQRIAALMGTGQLSLAVLSEDEARRMAEGDAPFEGYPPTPVLALAALGDRYQLFAAPSFPTGHAHRVTEALGQLGVGTPPDPMRLDIHEGAARFWADHLSDG